MKIYVTLLLIALTSCSNNTPLFKVDTITENDEEKIQFVPNMSFEEITDSTYFYFTKEDYAKAIISEISKGEQIYKSDKFEIRVLLRKYYQNNKYVYEFVLRSFSKDFKIIDSYTLGRNVDGVICNGEIEKDLILSTTCSDRSTTTASIDKYGKFVINE